MIRSSLVEVLEDNYEVEDAASGEEALKKIEQKPYDLIISDINMSPINGIDLIERVKSKLPTIKYALITGYEVENYIRLIKDHKISNIITKTSPFDFNEFLTIIENIFNPDTAFGLRRYFEKDSKVFEYDIRTLDDKQDAIKEVLKYFKHYAIDKFDSYDLRLILEELINNALFHAFLNEEGKQKYNVISFTSLQPDEKVYVEYGKDSKKIGFSITDNGGNLTLEKILETLERQINLKGLFDENGRGLFLSRLLSNQMIINVQKGVKTQFIILISKKSEPTHKPLYINFS